MPTEKKKVRKTIGITDFLSFTEAGLSNIPCKIDTGADTCSIHCERARIKVINGEDHLVFKLMDRKHPLYSGVEVVKKDFKEVRVRSSFGDYEIRYQVVLSFKLFNKTYSAPFNLSNRSNMKYPVLLGRKFLSNKFIVDVSKRNLSQKK